MPLPTASSAPLLVAWPCGNAKSWGAIASLAGLLATMACSDDGAADGSAPGGSSVASAGSSGAGSSEVGGSMASGGEGGSGGQELSGGGDETGGSGGDETGGSGGDETGGTGGSDGSLCPDPVAFPVAGQTLVIEAVNFARDEVVILNVTDEDVVLPASWQWCSAPAYSVPTYGFPVETDTVIPAGETYKFNVPGTARSGDTGLDLIAGEGEFALYNSTGGFFQEQNMESYVTWGAGGGGRENVGSKAGLWTFGQRVEVQAGDNAIQVDGRTDRATGYISVRSLCL